MCLRVKCLAGRGFDLVEWVQARCYKNLSGFEYGIKLIEIRISYFAGSRAALSYFVKASDLNLSGSQCFKA